MVHIAAVLTEAGPVFTFGHSDETLEEAIATALEYSEEVIPDDQIHKNSYPASEFVEFLNEKLQDVKAFNAEEKDEAVEWVEQTKGADFVIESLGDPEQAAKDYLEGEDYVVYKSKDKAVEVLSEEIFEDIGGTNALHGQYAGDTLEKVVEFVAKHGWLKLHDILAAAI